MHGHASQAAPSTATRRGRRSGTTRCSAHDEAAALILGLQDRETRDRAAEWMEGAEADPALRLWRALARRCVGPYGEHAAAPLTLAGWVAWSTGDEPTRPGRARPGPARRPRLPLRPAPAPGVQRGHRPGAVAPVPARGLDARSVRAPRDGAAAATGAERPAPERTPSARPAGPAPSASPPCADPRRRPPAAHACEAAASAAGQPAATPAGLAERPGQPGPRMPAAVDGCRGRADVPGKGGRASGRTATPCARGPPLTPGPAGERGRWADRRRVSRLGVRP